MVIEGEKVILRKKRVEDAWDEYRWRKDPEISELDGTVPISIPFPLFLSSFMWEITSSGDRTFSIYTKDGKHIGSCMYYDLDERKKEAEIGIIIGEKSFWGKGYGRDVVKSLTNFLFKEKGLRKIKLRTLPTNERAIRCFKSCGFEEKGIVRGMGKEFLLMELDFPGDSP